VKYAVVGDVVNLAARVQGLSRDLEAGIVLTEATRARLPGVALRDRGLFPVKGRNEPVRVYELDRARGQGDDA
jgi:adenylate cyclase